MVGKSTLFECLKDSRVSSVLIINRKPIGIQHEKLTELIIEDFYDLSSIKDKFKEIDACFYCLGVSSSEVSKEAYVKITYDMCMHFAEILSELNPDICFCYVSGVGTSKDENSKMFWANVKGKLENKLLSMTGIKAYMIRLGMLYPAKGIRSKTKSFDVMYRLMRPFLYIYKLISPKGIITSENFGKAMINAAIFGSEKKYLWNPDLNVMASRPAPKS
jgi:hypothetical protein